MIAHLPTVMLAIGYVVFWMELYFGHDLTGHTTPWATILFVIVAMWIVVKDLSNVGRILKSMVEEWRSWAWPLKMFMIFAGAAVLAIMACALYASFLPPHLVQESDAMVYHMTLPRQHLIQHSFEHIAWSTADLYLLPMDFALAPYWFVTSLPNKWPQFLFLIGFLGVCMQLAQRFSVNRFAAALLAGIMVIGFHHVGIQVGTAMLDVAVVYLLLAALDSFLKGNAVLFGIELAFYFWSKSFVPVQSLLILVVMVSSAWILQRQGWKLSWISGLLIEKAAHGSVLKKGLIVFAVASCLIGGPFVFKSLQKTGSPLFPFYPGLVTTNAGINADSPEWQEIVEKAKEVRATRDQYGSGRSPVEFLKHLWLIAVPEEGVNNRYDYPVGLMYLLCLLPFVVCCGQSLRDKEFSVLPLFVIAFWATWWMGTHQTRFLILPTTLMAIVVAAQMKRPSVIFLTTVLMALSLTALSVVRAHRADWGRSSMDVLRSKDQRLLAMKSAVLPGQVVDLDFFDAAFAEFPVNVKNINSVFVLRLQDSH